MTNLQLLLSIGIPSVLVTLSWIQQNSRMARLETSFDRNNESVDKKFDSVRAEIQGVRTEMVALRDSIHRDMIALHERVAVVEAKHS